MVKPKHFLVSGGVISACISFFHLILVFKPELYRFVSPGQESALGQIAGQGIGLITIATIALVLIFALWSIYAFSGAGLIRPLPLQRSALIAIGVIYILRGLFLPSEINMILTQGFPMQFAVFSAVSFVTGLLYLIGILKQRAMVVR